MDINQSNKKLNHLKIISTHLDSRFEGPFGIRFGLDALLGLIPFAGDMISTLVSVYIIAQSARMGVGPSTLVRMAINVGIENLVDTLPFFGNLFDFYWKANNKNIVLLESHLRNPARETLKSRMVVALISFCLLVLLLLSGYLTYVVIESIMQWVLSYKLD